MHYKSERLIILIECKRVFSSAMVILSYSCVVRSDLDRYFSSSEQARACLRPHLHSTKNEIRLVRTRQHMPLRGHSIVRSVEGVGPIARSGKPPGEINRATR